MEIKRIAEQNPWWEDKAKIDRDDKVAESLSRAHKMALPQFEEKNLLITGPRQVGKTTFLKLRIKELIEEGLDPKRTLYFSCETLKDFNDIVELVRFSDSLIAGKKYLFLDEITFVDDWQRAIKFILDSPIAKDKVIYVTGSSSVHLKKETFPGRPIKTEHFMPLSFRDFCMVFGSDNLKKEIAGNGRLTTLSAEEINAGVKRFLFYFNEIDELFGRFVCCGGFPRSAYEFMEGEKIKEETFEIYWKWIVADMAKLGRSERTTSSVLFGALKNYGTRFSLNSVAKETELGSHVTVRDYLEVLEDLFVLRSVFPMEAERGIEAFRRMRKVYFTDPFLFHVFKKQIMGAMAEDAEMPRIVEGIVAEHLARKFKKVFYYSQKKEIDFYYASMDCGLEVKWQNRISKSDFPPQIGLKNKVLLCKKDFDFFETERLLVIPVSAFLLLL